jgi:hypothetical protein
VFDLPPATVARIGLVSLEVVGEQHHSRRVMHCEKGLSSSEWERLANTLGLMMTNLFGSTAYHQLSVSQLASTH